MFINNMYVYINICTCIRDHSNNWSQTVAGNGQFYNDIEIRVNQICCCLLLFLPTVNFLFRHAALFSKLNLIFFPLFLFVY